MRRQRIYLIVSLVLVWSLVLVQKILATGLETGEIRNASWEAFRQSPCSSVFLSQCYEAPVKRDKLLFSGCGKNYGNILFSVVKDMKRYPVLEQKENATYFEDSWMEGRTYGGNRGHEGVDIMPEKNTRGLLSVVSVSDGVIEKIGWIKLGGYRIGIRSTNGVYFYYAHLASYEEGLQEGTTVRAGDLLGTMGDSGYGEEGTIGKFPVHLHFGIYLDVEGEEQSINPYEFLKYWAKR